MLVTNSDDIRNMKETKVSDNFLARATGMTVALFTQKGQKHLKRRQVCKVDIEIDFDTLLNSLCLLEKQEKRII